ncbi:MAG: Unknown protein [uncultured Sulfurovum sp.]|uniref:Uncharacterized protein n=1 Tax=uncultured Sulfurovum sp. TaxID=269237 RepID=A0A6S6U9R3_9BACT|nr:MAG: Unknown protein [uncultured Sulfurovum sp.]
MNLRNITNKKGNYLVGFHDVDPWSSDHKKILCLRAKTMEDIPSEENQADVVLVDLESGNVKTLDKTICWNFPQGGRQAWVRHKECDKVIYNTREDNKFIAKLVDKNGKQLLTYDKPTYAISPCSNFSYGLNYERLYRLGAYGYAGVTDESKGDYLPIDDGIWKTDLSTGKSKLILSIKDVAETVGNSKVLKESEHYLTHIVPSPNGEKISFLHRYWLPDGGIQTRLVICDSNGKNPQVWDEGFMSHFDWIDNSSIIIWGKPASKAQALRSSSFLKNIPFLSTILQGLKPLIKKVLGKRIIPEGYYKLVSYEKRFESIKYSELLPTEDGHPSFCPSDRSLLLTDTYPDANSERELIILDTKDNNIINLCKLKESQLKPSENNFDSISKYVDSDMLQKFSKKHFVHSRSGVHCDFHPRWRRDGNYVCIDSNHEDFRSVYIIEIKKDSFK